jgi:hypothetical protein
MANRNPWQARLAKALKRKPFTIDEVLRLDSAVLAIAFVNVVSAPTPEAQRLHLLAYCAISGKLAKQLEVGELEARIAALECQDAEAELAERNGAG